jgi:dynein intermediate chain 2
MDGTLDVWDFIFKQNDPTLTLQVCNSPIQSVKVQEHGKIVAVGARDGSTTLVELSDSLSKIQNNEKVTFSQVCITVISKRLIRCHPSVDAGARSEA